MSPGESEPADRVTHREIGTEYLLISPLLMRPKRWHTRAELHGTCMTWTPTRSTAHSMTCTPRGIVHLDGERVRVSACARHINELVGDVIEEEDER